MNATAEIERLSDVLAADTRFAAAILFGSAARDALRPASDVDVAVIYSDDAARASVGGELLIVLGQLGRAASRDVHLVDLEKADCELRRSVFASGRVLFDRGQPRLRDLQVETLLEYFDWEYARRVIDAGQRRRLESAGG